MSETGLFSGHSPHSDIASKRRGNDVSDSDDFIQLLLGKKLWQRPPAWPQGVVPPQLEQQYARAYAARKLGKVDAIPMHVLAALARAALADEEQDVRRAALEVLIEKGEPRLVHLVLTGAAYDPSPEIRYIALEAGWNYDHILGTQLALLLAYDTDKDVAKYAEQVRQLTENV